MVAVLVAARLVILLKSIPKLFTELIGTHTSYTLVKFVKIIDIR